MGTRKRDSKGDYMGRAAAPNARASTTEGSSVLPATASVHQAYVNDQQLLENMTWLSNQSGGWLRLIPSNDEGVIYIKWKFNNGKWPNHYVMTRVQHWQVSYGIALLRDKIQSVYDGSSAPAQDRPFE